MYPRLRDLREDKDMNQTQLAKILGMSQTGYSKYETGENDIPTAVLIKLARFYNTSIDYLLGETNNPKRYNQISQQFLAIQSLTSRVFYHIFQGNSRTFHRLTSQSLRASMIYQACGLDKKIPKTFAFGIFWRRHPESNRGQRCCRPLPYRLAIAPYSCRCCPTILSYSLSEILVTKIKGEFLSPLSSGADYGDRTRHLDLGKVALYQMS